MTLKVNNTVLVLNKNLTKDKTGIKKKHTPFPDKQGYFLDLFFE